MQLRAAAARGNSEPENVRVGRLLLETPSRFREFECDDMAKEQGRTLKEPFSSERRQAARLSAPVYALQNPTIVWLPGAAAPAHSLLHLSLSAFLCLRLCHRRYGKSGKRLIARLRTCLRLRGRH